MKMIEKATGKGYNMPWDANFPALASGEYEAHPDEGAGERGPDMPGAQVATPGIEPQAGQDSVIQDHPTVSNLSQTVTAGAAVGPAFEIDPEATPAADIYAAEQRARELAAAPVAGTATGPVMGVEGDPAIKLPAGATVVAKTDAEKAQAQAEAQTRAEADKKAADAAAKKAASNQT